MKAFMAILIALVMFGCASQQKAAALPDNSSHRDVAVFETSKGEIQIELYPDKAPKTVANFESYVRSGFYNGTIFHRVIKGFMIQGGGYTADGARKDTMAPIPIESANGLRNTPGMVAMARTADPNSATSQFFINTADNPGLDYAPGNDGYTVFGKVVSGMDAVRAIESSQTWDNGYAQDWPVENITINGAYMKG